MTLQLVRSIHDRLSDANNNWPRNPFTNAERCAVILERRLARVARGRDVEFCIASSDEESGQTRYSATLFTSDLVMTGAMLATNERMNGGYLPGDVMIVPRTAIRGLTLHRVDYFGYDDEDQEDFVSFTATYEGMPPVTVGPPSSGAPRGVTSELFDVLQADLAKA